MYKCSRCGKTATKNLQKIWVVYPIYVGRYISGNNEMLSDGTEEGDNLFLCDECFQNFV